MEEKKMSLWQFDDAIKQVLENGIVFDEETGEVFFTSDDLESLNQSIDEKLNNIIGYIKECQLKSDTLEAKAKAADEIFQKQLDNEYRNEAKRLSKKAESLTKYLDGYMVANEMTDIKKDNGKATYTKTQVCEIDDVEKLSKWVKKHPEYDNFIKTEIKPSKTNIKKYLKDNNDETVDGASLIDKKTLKIK